MAKQKKRKMKTHKATAKRFRLTGTGKLMRTKGGKSHLRRRKSKRTKAQGQPTRLTLFAARPRPTAERPG